MASPEPFWASLPHTVTAIWHAQRPPLAALAAGLVLFGLGRLTGIRWLAAIAPGIALIVGWAAVAGAAPSMSNTVTSLPVLAFLALSLAGLARATPWRHAETTAFAALAVLGSWLLAGGPRDAPALLAATPSLALTGLLFGAIARCLMPIANRWAPLAAACGLRLALGLAGAPPGSLAVSATGIAVCALALTRGGPSLVTVPVLCALAGGASAVAIGDGRLTHLGLGAIDLAAVTPVIVLWLTPRLAPSLPIGRDAVAAVAAALIGAVITSGLVAIAHVR